MEHRMGAEFVGYTTASRVCPSFYRSRNVRQPLSVSLFSVSLMVKTVGVESG